MVILFSTLMVLAAAPAPITTPAEARPTAYMLEVTVDGKQSWITFLEGEEATITRYEEGSFAHKVALSATDAGNGMIKLGLVEISEDGTRREIGGARLHLKGTFQAIAPDRTISVTYVAKR